MRSPAIGIFDSGLGGLTVMAEIVKRLPGEDIVYFGDTARVPYGSKSREAVTRFSLEIASFLRSKNVKLIVVACNTASAYALPALRRTMDIPVIGVIRPGAAAALRSTRNGRIGVIGTEGTIRSGSYAAAINGDGAVKVFSRACPLFVPLVEEGWLAHPVTRDVAREYLADIVKKDIDTLVLGCTHYPLLKSVIRAAAGPGITLIDSAAATAEHVEETLRRLKLVNGSARRGKCSFFVSDAPEKFRRVGQRFLGYRIPPVSKVSLEER